MSSPTFSRLEQIFNHAAELATPARDDFLEQQAEQWPDLVAKARDLLRADELLAGQNTLRPAPLPEPRDEPHPQGKPDPLPAGTRVGPFVVQERLGEGGMGSVYRGQRADGEVEQQVALKLLHGSWLDPAGRNRFRLESQVLARLEHPGISRWIDAGETADGHPYLAMELIAGEPITVRCELRRSDLDERLALFRQACVAVGFAHRYLVVHRDLKPDHVLVDPDGIVKVVDFGIAKPLTPSFGSLDVARTATRGRIFSPLYAAPEQILGDEPSVATDVYGLGLVLYELLAGSVPFEGSDKTPRQLEDAILHSDAEPPSRRGARSDAAATARLAARLRGDLDSIILKCLRKEPAQRYDTVGELIADLDRYVAGRPVVAREGRWPYRAGKFLRRHWLPMSALATVSTVAFAGLAVFVLQAAETRRQRDRAQEVTDFMVSAFEAADPSNSLGAEVTAAQILDQSLRQLELDPPESSETAAELLLAIARVQRSLGLGNESWQTLDRAAGQKEPGGDADLARRLHRAQVEARLAQGEHRTARTMATSYLETEGLEIDDELFYETAVARSYYLDSENSQARARYEALLAKVRRLGQETTAAGFAVRRGLGLTLEALGELEPSLDLFSEMLEDRRRLLPAAHPDTLDALHLVQRVLGRLAEYEAQRRVTEEIVEQTEQLYGADSVPQARALYALATVNYELGEHASTVDQLQAGLAIYQQRYGIEHRQVAMAWFDLALFSGGDPAFAEVQDRAFAASIDIGRKVWPENHRNLLLFPVAYALWLNEHGRFGDGLATARQGLAVAEARPEFKEYDFYLFGELARAVAALKLNPSVRFKADVEHWLEELRGLTPDRLTKARQQALLVAEHGVEMPLEIASAEDPEGAE